MHLKSHAARRIVVAVWKRCWRDRNAHAARSLRLCARAKRVAGRDVKCSTKVPISCRNKCRCICATFSSLCSLFRSAYGRRIKSAFIVANASASMPCSLKRSKTTKNLRDATLIPYDCRCEKVPHAWRIQTVEDRRRWDNYVTSGICLDIRDNLK